jgi:hypothetical protein
LCVRHEIDVTAVQQRRDSHSNSVCIAYQPSAAAEMTDTTLLPFDLSAVRVVPVASASATLNRLANAPL